MSLNRLSLSIVLSIFILNISIASSEFPTPYTLVSRLIHYRSINAPSYDPSRTVKDIADIDLKSSISRALYLTPNASTALLHLKDIESELTASAKANGFLAHLGVGSNELGQLVYMDTGSSLLWINCEPAGYNVPGPIFDPIDSSSYETEDCDYSDICHASGPVNINCDGSLKSGACAFTVVYGKDAYTKGHLARETFKFGRSSHTLNSIVFGCARQTNLHTNGVLGLSNLRLSLISQQKSSRFSYCIGNINDPSYAYNTLVIGDKVELLGDETPLIVEDKYYVTLEGIEIGELSLDFDPQIFRRDSSAYTGGMIVDTGATLSFIPQKVLTTFEAVIIEMIIYDLELPLDRNETHIYKGLYTRLCFNGVLTRDLEGFPMVKFVFQGGATMELTVENIFQQIEDQVFCLAFVPSEVVMGSSVSLLGVLMQQYFYVAYDLKRMKLSFQRMDCNTVDEYIHDEL